MFSLNKNATLPGLALIMLVVSGFGVSIPVYAQQQSAQEPAQTQKQPTTAAPHQRGPGQELAHETREAAGEEQDETAEFKRSASVAFIAHITGLSLANAYLFSVVLNFVVVAGLIVWAGCKYLPAAFRSRTSSIQKAMQEAQEASEQARRRLGDIESRLKKLDGEIGILRDAAEKEAIAEEARIRDSAARDARKIVEGAQQEIAAAAKTARRDLTAFAADLAVGLAQKQIRIDAATDQALLRNFAGGLGSSSGAPGAPKDGH